MKEENDYTWEIQGRGNGIYDQINTGNTYSYRSFTQQDIENILKELYLNKEIKWEAPKPIEKIKRRELKL